MPDWPGLALAIDSDALGPLVREIIAEVLGALEPVRRADKMALTEAEAAELLSMNRRQLRDERLRHRISFTRVVGKQVRYTPQDLAAYLLRQREEASELRVRWA
jgi:hypothetical protein